MDLGDFTPCECCREAFEAMRQLAYTDQLTLLPNKRAFSETLEREVARGNRTQHHPSLALLDIDYFKKVNDTHGHPVGDELLAKLGGILKKNVRASDFVARIGGEEFAIILPETKQAHAPAYMERLRKVIEKELVLNVGTTRISSTASIGVVEMTIGEQPRDLYARADAALYSAKQSGRNQVFPTTCLA